MIETPTSTRPRQDLVGAYYEFDPAERGFIGMQVAPPFEVTKEDGRYGVVPRQAFLARINTKRALKAKTSSSEWTPESASWSLAEYAHKVFVEQRMANIYRGWFEAEEIASQICNQVVLTDLEHDVAGIYFNETTYPASGNTGATLAGGAEWTAAAGVPLTDVDNAKIAISTVHGVRPNAMIVTAKALRGAARTTQIGTRIQQMWGANLKPSELRLEAWKQLFELDQIYVADSVSQTPGAATPSNSKIWDEEYVWIGRIDAGRNISTPQAARALVLGGPGGDVAMDSWDEPDPKGNWVRGTRIMGPQNIGPEPCGYLIKNAV